MKIPRIAAAISVLMPLVVTAHPGHFDGAPIAHSAAHGLPYLLAAAALYIVGKQQVEKAVRAIRTRTRIRQ